MRFCSRFISCLSLLRRYYVEKIFEQGRRDSNPQPPVLETGALPIEPLPFASARRKLRRVAVGKKQPTIPQGKVSSGSPCAWCACAPTDNISSSRCARDR